MSVPPRPLSVFVVIVRDLEVEVGDEGKIDSLWTFSSKIVADVWVERRKLLDPTLDYGVFEVELDAGISEIPIREG